MIKIVIFTLLFGIFASINADENSTIPKNEDNASIINQELQKAMEQEKKFAKEQTFYDAKTYDFKGSEVNKASVKKVPVIEMDDPSIDSDSILGMSEEEGLSW